VDDRPARRKRGNYRGKKKLFNFQQTVELKEAELAAVGRALGPVEFNRRQQAILKALLSKTSNLKEKEGTEKVSKMMSTYNNERHQMHMKRSRAKTCRRIYWDTFPIGPWASKRTSPS
jgi:hypothetical protein